MRVLLVFVIIFFSFNNSIGMNVVDIRNNAIYLNTLNDSLFIIFYNSLSCSSCNRKLENAILSNDSSAYIAVLIRCPNSITARRERLAIVRNLVRTKNIFFDIHDATDPVIPTKLIGGLFAKYNVFKTPSLLFLKGNKEIYIDYDTLFPDSTNYILNWKTIIDRIRTNK